MKLGFTGSRRKLIVPQSTQLRSLIGDQNNVVEAHHGDCTGGDKEFHDLMLLYHPRVTMHIHSPKLEVHRAFVPIRSTDILWPPKDYLMRNRDIIENCDLLIGCPSSMTFSLRSGSWWTIEAAKKVNKPIIVILPDGSKDYFNVAIPQKAV